jgi:hypothetical protein
MNKFIRESLNSAGLTLSYSVLKDKINKTRIFALLVTCALLISACGSLPDLGLGGLSKSAESLVLQENTLEPTGAVLPEVTDLPKTSTLAEAAALPVENANPDSIFFRDEFEKDFKEDWDLNVISGLENQLEVLQENGELNIETLPPNDVNFVFMNNKHSYKDVIVQAEVNNSGPLDNAFSLICRASESGWYEFRISSNLYYELLRYDAYKKGDGSNAYTNLLNNRIGSSLINGGINKNIFSLSCVGSQITFLINGVQPYREKRPVIIEDTTYSDGTIGFGFLGYGKSLDGSFGWVETLKP